jgi:hypothetical protein
LFGNNVLPRHALIAARKPASNEKLLKIEIEANATPSREQDQRGNSRRPRSALQVDAANARITAYLGRRLADLALEQGIDPDVTRRARGEADFLTSRAQKLAPDNDEVKMLRDEVVKLLEPKRTDVIKTDELPRALFCGHAVW